MSKNIDEISDAEFLEHTKKLLANIKAEDDKRATYAKLKVNTEWEKIGVCGVDTGMIWIGDPCYILALPHTKGESEFGLDEVNPLPKTLGEDWGEFCDNMEAKEEKAREKMQKQGFRGQEAVQFNYEEGHAGLGVCMHSGPGDGSYPVYVRRNPDGMIAEAKIVFDCLIEDMNGLDEE